MEAGGEGGAAEGACVSGEAERDFKEKEQEKAERVGACELSSKV